MMNHSYVIFKEGRGFYIQSQASQLEFTDDTNGIPWVFNDYGEARDLAESMNADIILEVKEVTQDYRIMEVHQLKRMVWSDQFKDNLLGKFSTLNNLKKLIEESYEEVQN